MKPALFLLLLWSTSPLIAAPPTETLVGPVEILGYGIFNARYTGNTRPGNSERVGVEEVEGTFSDFTTTIEARDKLVFGIQYVLNSPGGAPFDVIQVITLPDEGMHAPSGKVFREMREKVRLRNGKKMFHGYGFDFPWEKVPGEWSFEVWYQQYKLAARKFRVVLPETDVDAKGEADADAQLTGEPPLVQRADDL